MDHQQHHIKPRGKRLIWAIGLNLLITVSQVAGGLISGSLALLSDALHNFSDVSALVISLIALKLTTIKRSREKTFGYKRAEIIAAFINAVSLLVIALFLIIESGKRLAAAEPVKIDPKWVIGLAAFSILANGLSVLIIKKDVRKNLNMKSVYLHLFTDMLTSIAVLAGGLMILFYGIHWIDSLLTILIAVYLIYVSTKLLLNTLHVLMQFTPSQVDLDEIATFINKIPAVNNIHHVHSWRLNENEVHFEAHVDFIQDLPISTVCEILRDIEHNLVKNYGVDHVTLQPEFGRHCRDDLVVEEESSYE